MVGSQGDWYNGKWQWYNPEVNGYWGDDGKWYWGQRPTYSDGGIQ